MEMRLLTDEIRPGHSRDECGVRGEALHQFADWLARDACKGVLVAKGTPPHECAVLVRERLAVLEMAIPDCHKEAFDALTAVAA